MSEKHICVVTGSRADYGCLKLLLRKIENSNILKLSLLVTGMHLLKEFGNTIEQIRDDDIPITKVIPMYESEGNERNNLGISLGRAIANFTQVLDEINPHLLLIDGDRFESLAAVIAASTLSIPIAHIHGGENVSEGQIDEQIRHAITKFAHIHFPATEESYERLKLMGEEEWRIHMVGSPDLDMIYEEKLYTKKETYKNLGLNENEKTILCIQHPYLIEPEKSGEKIKITLQVLKDLDLQTVILYPNNDPGKKLIIKEIKAVKGNPKFKIFKNLKRKEYLSLLKNIDLLIGNSSSGINESPSFNLPVVNIGKRNRGRETAENVIHANHDYEDIKKKVITALSEEFKTRCQKVKNPYGEGGASDKIVNVLEKLVITKELLVKKLTYNL